MLVLGGSAVVAGSPSRCCRGHVTQPGSGPDLLRVSPLVFVPESIALPHRPNWLSWGCGISRPLSLRPLLGLFLGKPHAQQGAYCSDAREENDKRHVASVPDVPRPI